MKIYVLQEKYYNEYQGIIIVSTNPQIVKTFFDEAIFEVSNHLCTKWLKDMEAKKGVWRTRK
jgi:hypothetical protein